MATSATILSQEDIKNALSGLKDIKDVLYDIDGLTANFVQSESNLNEAVKERLKIIQEHKANLDTIKKKYKGIKNSEDAIAEKNKEQLAFEQKLLENQQKYNTEYEKLLRFQKEVSKEIAYQVKKTEEGVTLNEEITHELEKHLKGYAKISTGLKEIQKGFTTIFNVGKDIMNTWGKVNQTAVDYTKQIGGSAASMKQLTSETIRFVKEQSIGMKYNTSMEQLIKLQETYNKTIGRSIGLTNSQKESMAAMRKLAGDETTIKFTTSLENFGINPDEAGNIVGKMFSTASKSGLAWSKYSDNFLNNIKLAQNYTFRNGLDGLQSMAKKASEVKFNMQEAVKFADKVSSLEGAAKTGANLAVLGGSFAQFGNPLSMMYEANYDMEGLQDRAMNMFKNLGHWNNQTHMVDVDVYDKQRIRNAAQAMGMDYSSVMDMIQASGRANQVGKQLIGRNFTAEQTDYIKNTAQLDKNGQAFVNIRGQKTYIDDLSRRQLDMLMASAGSDSDNVKTIAQTLTGWNDTIEGLAKQRDAIKAGIGDIFGNNIQSVIFNVGTNVGLMTTAIVGSSLAKMIWGGAQMTHGTGNLFRGLAEGRTKGIDISPTPSTPTVTSGVDKRGRTYYHGAHGRFTSESAYKAATAIGTPAKTSMLSTVGKTFKTNMAKGGLAGSIMSGIQTAAYEFGGNNNHSTARKLTTTGIATLGAAAANFVPVVGPFLSMIVGTAVPLLSNMMDQRRSKYKEENGLTALQGDYTVRQLKRFKDFVNTGDYNKLTESDKRQLRKNGDFDALKEIKVNEANMNAGNVYIGSNGTVGKADGGWISGPGTSRSDSVLVPTSNGEFVINAKSASANASLVEAINASEGPIQPRGDILKPMMVNDTKNNSKAVKTLNFGKGLDINLNGTIKLDLGNKTITNIRPEDILNQGMINKIIKEIQKQMYRGFDRERNGVFKFA